MGIGNTINFLPFLRTLRNSFPFAKITLVTATKESNMVFIKSANVVDNFFFYKKTKLSLLITCLKIFVRQFDALFIKWHDDHWIARFIKSSPYSTKIGHVSSAGWESRFDDLLDIKVNLKAGASDKEQYLALAKAIGVEVFIDNEFIELPVPASQKADQVYSQLTLNGNTNFIGLHFDCSSKQEYKNIGASKWSDVLSQLLVDLKDVQFLLLGSGEDDTSLKIANFYSHNNRVINLLNRLTIDETAAIIKKLKLLIGNDSSLKTIASALGVPAVVPYGCTDFSRSAPIYSTIRIVRLNLNCSPCDKFGKTNWDSCTHKSCVNNLYPEQIIKEVNSVYKNLSRTVLHKIH